MGGSAGLRLQENGTAGSEFVNVRQTQRLSAGELFRVRGQRDFVVGGDLASRLSGGMDFERSIVRRGASFGWPDFSTTAGWKPSGFSGHRLPWDSDPALRTQPE